MTSLSDLDRLHAAHDQRFPSSLNAARWHDMIDREWPALRAYLKALEYELAFHRARMDPNVTTNIGAILSTDAARAQMEDADG